MADRIPLRIVNLSSGPTIGEFRAGDTLGIVHGGTGVSSITTLKDDLGLNDLALSSDLNDIDPVLRAALITPSRGDSLVWNGLHWTVSALNPVGELSALTDVNISSLVHGQSLVYFSSTGKWENSFPAGGASAVDHGVLIGLDDNDHPQYVLSSTNSALSSLVASIEASTVALSSYIATNSGDHGLLTGLLDNDHPQYVLSSTNVTLSSQVELNEGDILDLYAYIASNEGLWGGTLSAIDHGALSGLGDNDHPQYVLSATNQALSSLVSSIEASTVSLSSYIAANEAAWSSDNDVSTLSGLGDTSITGIQDGQIIQWDEGGQVWVNDNLDHTVAKVYNNTAEIISKGDVVTITGAHNANTAYIDLARADSQSSMPAIGVAQADIAINGEGLVVTFGRAAGLNTSGMTEGGKVYVSPTSKGEITQTRPTAGNHLVQNVGVVMKADASNGVIKVTGIGRSNDIPNAVITTASGDADYIYIDDGGVWKKIAPSDLAVSGLTGAQGSQGATGAQGLVGPQGLIGDQGPQGFQGRRGAQGLQGQQGDQGSQGLIGDQGPQGFQGRQGSQGDTGPQGVIGPQGLIGDQGPQGFQGRRGAQGFQGATGSQGLQGQQGEQGPQGLIGDQGPQGFQGRRGAQGFQGSTGPQGLQGQQGEQGPQGVVGPQGLIGDQGPQGFQGRRGAQGFQGNTGAQGLQGQQGEQGPQGLIGDQGPQGFQGRRGAQGFQGATGAQGLQGQQGEQGPQGLIGDQGPQGFQGRRGAQGFQGATGPQGVQGATGPQGDQGPQGLIGDQGPQGFQGRRGAQGFQGNTGAQGLTRPTR